MPSFKLIVEYDGSNYNGFQRQIGTEELREQHNHNTKSSIRTIQSELERAISSWSGVSIISLRMRSSSRTDKGVHAKHQVVAVDNLNNNNDSMDSMIKATNSRLPLDIVVKTMEPCGSTFEPRKEAIMKRYSYTMRYKRRTSILNSGSGQFHTIRRTALFCGPCLYTCPWALDDCHMTPTCTFLTGVHDFSAFVHKKDRTKKDNTMNLTRFDVDIIDDDDSMIRTVRFQLEARGFRRSMVRNLVGFVVEVCRGEIDAGDNLERIWKETTSSWVKAVPASGLCLEYVQY